MTERWVKVAGHERYIVSDRGRVRLGRVNAPILKGSYDKDGYHRVRIDDQTVRVHRLVCEAFHGLAPKGRPVVAHNDGNNRNNAAENLRWVNAAENVMDAIRHGTFHCAPARAGEGHPLARLSDAECAEIRALAKSGTSQRQIASRFGVAQSHVCRIVNGSKRLQGIAQPQSVSGLSHSGGDRG